MQNEEYSTYLQKKNIPELIDILENMDKDSFPERFEMVVSEVNKRKKTLGKYESKKAQEREKRKGIQQTTEDMKRGAIEIAKDVQRLKELEEEEELNQILANISDEDTPEEIARNNGCGYAGMFFLFCVGVIGIIRSFEGENHYVAEGGPILPWQQFCMGMVMIIFVLQVLYKRMKVKK